MKKTIAIVSLLTLCAAPAFAMDDMKMTQMMVDDHMKMMDTNGDGMVSMDEGMDASKKMFMDADMNHDGMMSKKEMMDMKMKEMSMMKDDKMMMKK